MGNWLINHILNFLSGIFFAVVGYFVEIKGAFHVMWLIILFDLITGILNSIIRKKERFSMSKFMIAIVRAMAVTVFVALLYGLDKEMHQTVASSYYIAAYLISGFILWSAADNMDELLGGGVFKLLKDYIVSKVKSSTGVDLKKRNNENTN